jgi:dinuclear metal center YbgI/SA1388 family protein
MPGVLPKVSDILTALEALAPSSLAEDWDNPGLQVGDPSRPAEKILFSLDPTLEALREAAKRGANVLLTHHPLLFRPVSRVDESTYPGSVLAEACRKGISIVAAHTNLDATEGGINDSLAQLLHLRKVQALQPKEKGDVGIGRIGDLPAPLSLGALAEKIKSVLGSTFLRVSGDRDAVVRRVAVVGGAGGDLVATASRLGADVLVTGEIRHHEALFAEHMGVALVDAGHYETEKPAFELFADKLIHHLKKAGYAVSVETYSGEKPPLKYE